MISKEDSEQDPSFVILLVGAIVIGYNVDFPEIANEVDTFCQRLYTPAGRDDEGIQQYHYGKWCDVVENEDE